ncbi:MAG: hypothetical protein ACRELC_04380 [Gemmatimonadota bacterium]
MMWLLLDPTIHQGVCGELESRGVRCIHAGIEGLGAADPVLLLQAAVEDECALVTRNYHDFARLAEAYRAAGRRVPLLLFLAPEVPTGDVRAQAAAIETWLEEAGDDPVPGPVWVGRSLTRAGRAAASPTASHA